MKQHITLLLQCFFALILSSSPMTHAEPVALGQAKTAITKYYDSGLYHKELEKTISEAQRYIEQRAIANQRDKNHKKLALVLDIDETSISNYHKMLKRKFVNDYAQIHKEILAADSPVIKPMLTLYQNALKHGVHVFFVTGRFEDEREATEKNLLKAGYKLWSGLYLRPNSYNQVSIIPFKSQMRANIEKMGYTILASIGDQFSDIRGGYTEKGFKLPNPFYSLP